MLACLCACGDPEPAKTLDASKEMRPHIEKLYATWATLDTDKLAPFYSKAPGIVYYDIAPLKYANWSDYASGFKKASANWKSLKVDVNPDFRAFSNGPIAWATFTANFTIEKKDGQTERGEARVTELFQKVKESWIIIHEHVSVPMMESPKPVPVNKKAVTKKAAAKKKKARRR